MAWAEARRNSDFEAFLPYLEKNVELKHRYLECFKDMGKSDYDILLDDYQEGARSEEITAIFERVKEVVIPLIREVKAAEPVPSDFAHGHFPVEKQEMVGREILERLGYSSESWRLDPTVHPFATSISVDDIRLTTRYSEADAGVDLPHGTRVRARHLRERDRPRARAHPARGAELDGAPRVAEQAVGEPRLPVAAVLAVLLPADPGGLPRAAGRRHGRDVLALREPRRARLHPGRGGRGHLRHAHHPALRARAGDHRRPLGAP